MNELPSIVDRKDLRHHWVYLNEDLKPFAIVARYDFRDEKKRFHQFMRDGSNTWAKGAPTPLPLFGIHTLPNAHSGEYVYIFEGEKCTQAAHSIGLAAITSMMGSSQAPHADWSILARYRHIKKFVLVPDNDIPGKKYIETVYQEIKKACPTSAIFICELPTKNKGDDLVDWIKLSTFCPINWDGFSPIDDPHSSYLRIGLEKIIEDSSIDAKEYFSMKTAPSISFDHNPLPLEETLSEVLPCPVHTLPAIISSWLQGQANHMQIPVDFIAVPFMVYTASLIGRKRALELRPNSGWIEFPNLWGMLIGRPSVMKTPAMEGAIKPLNKLAKQALKSHKEALRRYNILQNEWEAKTKAIREINKKNLKESLGSDTQLHIAISEEEPPEKPIQKRFKTDDTTVEKLGEILIENPQGTLVYRDELSGWLNSFDKTGRENDRQFYLESWSGKKDFNIDRIKRGSLYIPALFLSIFGSIQPGPLSKIVRSSLRGDIGDDGFLQRFQMMVWPDIKSGWQLVNDFSFQKFETEVDRAYEFLDQMNFDSDANPIILNFCKDAQPIFDVWQKKHELRLRSGDLPTHLEAHLAKYKKLLPALCLIHEHLEGVIQNQYPQQITSKSLLDSLQWLKYLESHAHRVYLSGMNTIVKTSKDLIARIQKGEITAPFSVREVYHGRHWSGLASANEVQEVIDFLVEKGYLIGSRIESNGRPTQKYWVHPKVYET